MKEDDGRMNGEECRRWRSRSAGGGGPWHERLTQARAAAPAEPQIGRESSTLFALDFCRSSRHSLNHHKAASPPMRAASNHHGVIPGIMLYMSSAPSELW